MLFNFHWVVYCRILWTTTTERCMLPPHAEACTALCYRRLLTAMHVHLSSKAPITCSSASATNMPRVTLSITSVLIGCTVCDAFLATNIRTCTGLHTPFRGWEMRYIQKPTNRQLCNLLTFGYHPRSYINVYGYTFPWNTCLLIRGKNHKKN